MHVRRKSPTRGRASRADVARRVAFLVRALTHAEITNSSFAKRAVAKSRDCLHSYGTQMFRFVLLASGMLPFSPPGAAPRACSSRLAVVEVDTTVDAATMNPSQFLRPRSAGGPRYPTDLRDQRVQGDVRATFVVDTLGRVVRGSSGILEESHPAFGQAVCTFLNTAAFAPVVIDGKRVAVRIVGMRFAFSTRGG